METRRRNNNSSTHKSVEIWTNEMNGRVQDFLNNSAEIQDLVRKKTIHLDFFLGDSSAISIYIQIFRSIFLLLSVSRSQSGRDLVFWCVQREVEVENRTKAEVKQSWWLCCGCVDISNLEKIKIKKKM